MKYSKYSHKIEINFNSDDKQDSYNFKKLILEYLKENNINLKGLEINTKTNRCDFYDKGKELLDQLNIKTKSINTVEELNKSDNYSMIIVDKRFK